MGWNYLEMQLQGKQISLMTNCIKLVGNVESSRKVVEQRCPQIPSKFHGGEKDS